MPIRAIAKIAARAPPVTSFLPEQWAERVPAKEDMEERMLDFAFDVQERSRLSCQIEVTDELDGLEVMMPERHFSGQAP